LSSTIITIMVIKGSSPYQAIKGRHPTRVYLKQQQPLLHFTPTQHLLPTTHNHPRPARRDPRFSIEILKG
jgi:hypothetical protein